MLAMPTRVLPPKSELQKMLERGMTHKEIAEAVSREVGQPVSRSTVSAAIHRAGLSAASKKYVEEIPWTVKEHHLTHYAARMLRLLGRRRAGIQNSEEMDARLDSWLKQLRDEHAVVTYIPDSPEGFYYVDGDWPKNGIPIVEEIDL